MKPFLSIPLCGALFLWLSAHGDPADFDPIGLRYVRSGEVGSLGWQGGVERTDFVQWSTGMGEWRHLPVLTHGEGANSYGVDSDAPKMFMRLHHTDQAIPEGFTPETADFDGDGFCNLYEVLNGRDPLAVETTPDGDADGAADATEQVLGTDPAAEDHPAVKLSVAECPF